MDQHVAVDPTSPAFLFVTCQVGAEGALKSEIARRWPFPFAYSRPGFLTFKVPSGESLPDDFDLKCVFARTCGFSLGKAEDPVHTARAQQVWQLAGGRSFEALHVWQRDPAPVGYHGFEPSITEEARTAEEILRQVGPGSAEDQIPLPNIAEPGQLVLDCILVDPDSWWVGFHRAAGESCYPGGMREIGLPEHAVSRAYLKMCEALAWSQLPLRSGDHVAEIGCAPGGASQALLDCGLHVMGVDPAQVDERVLAHPKFKHIRKRGADVRRRDFRGVKWLAADMNVAPQYTLDTIEAIVTHSAVNIRGALLTLKLLDWGLADEIPQYLERIRRWGFRHVRARQLVHNRQEICVAALKS